MLQHCASPKGVVFLLCYITVLINGTIARSIHLPGQALWNRLYSLNPLSKRDEITPSSTSDCAWSCEVGSCSSCLGPSRRRAVWTDEKTNGFSLYRDLDEASEAGFVQSNETIGDHELEDRSIQKRDFKKPGRMLNSRVGEYCRQMNVAPQGYDSQFPKAPIGFFTGDVAPVVMFQQFQSGTTINWGTAGLHGCTMLTIVSKRAVFMAHFWETYSTRKTDDLGDNGARQYRERVIQALSMTTVANPYNPPEANPPNDAEDREKLINNNRYLPPYGTAIDWTYFNGANDDTQAWIMTPLPDNIVKEDAGVAKYDQKLALLEEFIVQNVPALKEKIVRFTYNRLRYTSQGNDRPPIFQSSQDKNDYYSTARGMCLFQYDGAGNWRIFYQDRFKTGTSN